MGINCESGNFSHNAFGKSSTLLVCKLKGFLPPSSKSIYFLSEDVGVFSWYWWKKVHSDQTWIVDQLLFSKNSPFQNAFCPTRASREPV